MSIAGSQGEYLNATSLGDRAIHRRAIELATWGMPAVSMAAIRASLKRDLDADCGDIIYFSKVMEPRHEFLTANNQTPYVGPDKVLFEKTWVMPDVEKVS